MAWTIDLSQVPTGLETLPKGTYTFSLLPGAKYSDRDPNRVEAQLAVVTPTDHSGRRMFLSYPDPESFSSKGKKQDWVYGAFKRLVEALGADIEPNEDPVTYLNRAQNLHVEFDVIERTDDTGTLRSDVNIFKPRPAKN